MKQAFKRLAAVATTAAPLASFAATTGPDFTAMTSQIDMTTTITAIMAIGLSIMGLLLAVKGVKIIWRMFKGA